MKRNGHCTFKAVFDSWGARSDENINSDAILSFDAVCVGSPVIIMLQKKLTDKFKEKFEILSSIKDHRKKVGKQGRHTFK